MQIVVDYYLERNHKVVALVPQYYLINKVQEKLADDIGLLNKYIDQGILFVTPAKDSDDSYILKYAQTHNGVVISNDMFRDFIEKSRNRSFAHHWIKTHCCSYIFIANEFMYVFFKKINTFFFVLILKKNLLDQILNLKCHLEKVKKFFRKEIK